MDGTQATQAIILFVRSVSAYALPFATAMASIGVLSMAIIQAAKDMLPLRSGFQRRFLARWLRRKAAEAASGSGAPPDPAAAERDLVKLATAGDAKAFYDLPIEQLCGQMNVAMQIV